MNIAIETIGLGKRFGSTWALEDFCIDVPEGSVAGLVGANGAGKTTLIRMLAGLSRPTTGEASVAGRHPADDAEFLASIGYLAQEIPLYSRWTAADHLALGAHMNPRWDETLPLERLRALRIPLDKPVAQLSGGMRSQVALGLALGKRPDVLLLDEPVAALDPLARREFLSSLLAAVADGGLTVLLSSHLVADLERVCDHLIVVGDGRAIVCADTEELLATHKAITAPAAAAKALEQQHHVVSSTRTAREVSAVARREAPIHDPSWRVDDVSLEEVVLAYLAGDAPTVAGELASVSGR
jgi:ABC-2 type transport system ATP-binding protein